MIINMSSEVNIAIDELNERLVKQPPIYPESEIVGKLLTACLDDNFNEFRKLIKPKTNWRRSSRPKRQLERQLALETIIAILSVEKCRHGSKYISLIFIQNFNLISDKTFLDEVTNKDNLEDNRVLMHFVEHFVVKHNCVGNLISCLMPDWFDAASHEKGSYCLIKKLEQYERKGRKLLEKLYDVLDDESQLIYHDTCLRIIHQYLLELHRHYENYELTFLNELLCIDKVFSIRNQEYRQLILEVIVVFWPPSYTTDEYVQCKQKVVESIQEENIAFFQLAFLLKEQQSVKFQSFFETFINEAKRKFGDYFRFELKRHVRLLATIADRQGDLQGTLEFIFQRFPFIEVNSTIMASFYAVRDFKVVNLFPFESKKLQLVANRSRQIDIEELEAIIREYKKNDQNEKSRELKRFVFGRNINCGKTVFERILSTPDSSDLIELVWNKFELSSKEEILNIRFSCYDDISEDEKKEPTNVKSHQKQGKLLLSHVIDSKDDKNLTTFLMPTDSEDPTYVKRDTYLKLKSDQFCELSEGQTLYERHLITCLNDVGRRHENEEHLHDYNSNLLSSTSFVRIFSLIEEMSEYGIVYSSETIDKLISLVNNPKFYVQLGFTPNERNPEGKLRKKIYIVDDLLATIISYCKESESTYSAFKKKCSTLSPLYELIFLIAEGKEQDFIESFLSKLMRLEKICRHRYKIEERVEHYVSNFLYTLLWAAVIHDRRLIIDHILKYKNFTTIQFKFPDNIRSTETCRYVAMKLLESGHEIGKNELPSTWITSSDFEKFLDSQIKCENTDLIELDCNFLLEAETRKYQVNSRIDVDNKLIFSEDTDSLNYIINKENLKGLITHPVIATYVNLKAHKYRNIYFCNLLMFVLVFVLPFGALFISRFLLNVESLFVNLLICKFSIFLQILRELFQIFVSDQTCRKYWNKVSNRLQVLLIVSSFITVIILMFEGNHSFQHSHLLVFFVVTIFLGVTVLFTKVPISSVSLNMMMLRKASQTFLYFLLTFTLILMAFSISFVMIFGKKVEELGQKEDDIFQNFSTFPFAFSKVLMMLSGEYTIEPFNMSDLYQVAFFSFFVVSTFIIYNLIQGLTFDDVQKLREDASRLILEHNAKKFIETSETFYEFYEDSVLFYTAQRTDVREFLAKISKRLIARNPFIHNIGKVYINVRTKEISTEINRRQVLLIREKVDNKIFENILAILGKKRIKKSYL